MAEEVRGEGGAQPEALPAHLAPEGPAAGGAAAVPELDFNIITLALPVAGKNRENYVTELNCVEHSEDRISFSRKANSSFTRSPRRP